MISYFPSIVGHALNCTNDYKKMNEKNILKYLESIENGIWK